MSSIVAELGAAAVAGTMSFVVGGLWYSPLMFLEPWAKGAGIVLPAPRESSAATDKQTGRTTRTSLKAAGKSEGQKALDEKQGGHGGAIFGIAYLLAIVAAYALSGYIPKDAAILDGALAGARLAVCFVATSFGINYAFAGKTFILWAIDAGYHLCQFMLMGAVIAGIHRFM